MKHHLISILLAAMPACAASDDGSAADESTTAPTTTSSPADDGACSPGTEACECIEGGLCVEGLVCASNICVNVNGDDSGGETGGPKPGETMQTDDTGGDDAAPAGSCEGHCGDYSPDGCYCTPSCDFGGDCCPDYEVACAGDCILSSACEADEVCGAGSGSCVPAYEHVYDVRVTRWEDHTPDCWDIGDCYADVKFAAYYGSQGEVYESAVQNDTAVASWESAPFELSINETDALQFVFVDVDPVVDNSTNSVCFPNGGLCGPVTVSYLHQGGATWDTRNDPDPSERFYVEVTFTAR